MSFLNWMEPAMLQRSPTFTKRKRDLSMVSASRPLRCIMAPSASRERSGGEGRTRWRGAERG
jgi:hypothetical protein